MHAIEVKNLNKYFDTLHAVNDISFTINHGEVLGFLGPNGAGKSTTMKMITGFLEPSDGQVAICGFDILSEPIKAKEKIGYLPEGAPLYGEMTPASFLNFIADIRGIANEQKQARIADVIQKIQLEGVLHQRIETLSKGFKRRVGLAQAILHDPEVLILDEPTDGLDPNQKHEVRRLIKSMAKDKAIIISTHILEEVDAVCTRAIIIAKGKLLFSGTPAELEAKSTHHNAVSLRVPSQSVAAITNALQALPLVEKIEQTHTSATEVELSVLPKSGQAILPQISELIRNQAWTVHEIKAETGRLDEVFRMITTAN